MNLNTLFNQIKTPDIANIANIDIDKKMDKKEAYDMISSFMLNILNICESYGPLYTEVYEQCGYVENPESIILGDYFENYTNVRTIKKIFSRPDKIFNMEAIGSSNGSYIISIYNYDGSYTSFRLRLCDKLDSVDFDNFTIDELKRLYISKPILNRYIGYVTSARIGMELDLQKVCDLENDIRNKIIETKERR